MALPALTPAEFAIMKALWALPSATVAQVRAELAANGSNSAYTTVMTLLGRMVAKGAVVVDKDREPFVYSAKIGRQNMARQRLRELLRDVFDNDARGLVLGLVEDKSLTAQELREVEQIVADLSVKEQRGK